MSKKPSIALAIIVIALAIGIGISYDHKTNSQIQENKTQEPIKIGFSTPLTGDAASWGQPIKQGAQIAIDEINTAGGIDGRKLEVIFEDDACDAKQASTVINKFISIDRVDVVTGPPCSSAALAIAPLTENNHTLFLTSGASSPKMADAGKYVFNLYPLDNLEFGYTAEYINDHNTRTVGMLWLNNDYGVGLRDAFISAYHGHIVASESFTPDSSDVKTQLAKIKEKNPEALVIISNPGESSTIIKQVNELNITAQLYANGPAIEADDFTQESRELAEGLIYAMPTVSNSGAYDTFSTTYQNIYHTDEEAGFLPPLGYDSIKLLAQAISDAHSTDADKLREALLDIDQYDGASGLIAFDKKGNIRKPFTFKQIINGKLVPLN